MKDIRKVIIPVAGWGTRSLPATKNIPKEMLPIYNKPVIQYVVEEAQRANIEDVIFVTNRDKTVIEDHFDYNLQLEGVLERAGKLDKLAEVRKVFGVVMTSLGVIVGGGVWLLWSNLAYGTGASGWILALVAAAHSALLSDLMGPLHWQIQRLFRQTITDHILTTLDLLL